jgi:hypothetical protein
VEKTLEGGKKGFLVSLSCIKLLRFLLIPRPMIMVKDGNMGTMLVSTPLQLQGSEEDMEQYEDKVYYQRYEKTKNYHWKILPIGNGGQ